MELQIIKETQITPFWGSDIWWIKGTQKHPIVELQIFKGTQII
jgi:hypothetical protein